jgi:steroid delta-isomerase-like uncharacterized protein
MTANNKALIRAHYDAMINWFDPDMIRTQLADEYYDHQSDRAMSVNDVICHAMALHDAFADLSVTLDDMIAESDRVAVRATWRGEHVGMFRGVAPTGKRFSFTGMVFWRVRAGQIAERWAEVDFASLMAQLAETQAA